MYPATTDHPVYIREGAEELGRECGGGWARILGYVVVKALHHFRPLGGIVRMVYRESGVLLF